MYKWPVMVYTYPVATEPPLITSSSNRRLVTPGLPISRLEIGGLLQEEVVEDWLEGEAVGVPVKLY